MVLSLKKLKVFTTTGISTMALGMGSPTSSLPLILFGVQTLKFQEKGFLIVLKSINGRKRKFLSLYPHSEKISGLMSGKVNVVNFLQCIMT